MHRNKIVAGVIALFVVLVSSAIVYTYLRPPLRFGITTGGHKGEVGEQLSIGWELINGGWFDARIEKVRWEAYPGQPASVLWVAGAVGSWRSVGSSMSVNPVDDGYLLIPLGEFVIPPQRRLPNPEVTSDSITFRRPRYYGLVARYLFTESGVSPMGKLTIKYTYMGLPLTLQGEFAPVELPGETG